MKCAIVGNGTSLTAEQLSLIHEAGIPSIACNRINLIYDKTEWRPAIYVHPESLAPDIPYIRENVDLGIECYIGEHFRRFGLEDASNIKWIKDCHHHLLPFHSEELPDEWHFPQPCTFGGSVNFAMQIAVLKGYNDLILIGCDLRYKTRNRSHFDPRYEHGGEQPPFYAARNAFYGHVQALNYIRRRNLNVTVTNATTGGALELWQRKKLEECLRSSLLETAQA